ncbi:SGNH/GDSL hydrolase family protein [Nocardioides bruguierae]|uniref:SGNH/GDSL hydrolase family protein n=1 Tax=Nocardioides bruguierae TaxID=2945102 RepID=A0A9X2IGT2_9ACTN|nr:SGNH/GDSL hydrolase family protein [Nocardioides bruguierae]MCL8024710.1 SGNH/GDSL hydrolase family protein [Nocardioides bruguierae]MCM0621894.1 SGNH/GDSL hydrolase family protein [Nocardioides bruguierae]
MRIVLLGDSHLARLGVRAAEIGAQAPGVEVVDGAVGGALAADLAAQVRAHAVTPEDVVVLSIGTNDAAPAAATPRETFRTHLTAVVDLVRARRWVYVMPPGVVPGRPGVQGRTNAALSWYAQTAEQVFRARRGWVVETRDLLETLGEAAFDEDGLHLSEAAYDVLVPELAAAVS